MKTLTVVSVLGISTIVLSVFFAPEAQIVSRETGQSFEGRELVLFAATLYTGLATLVVFGIVGACKISKDVVANFIKKDEEADTVIEYNRK